MDFGLDFEYRDAVPVVIVSGEVDVCTAPMLDERLQEVAGEGHKEVGIDLSGVSYLDSEGLKALIKLRNSLGHGGEVRIVGARGSVQRVFEMSGLSRIFKLTG